MLGSRNMDHDGSTIKTRVGT